MMQIIQKLHYALVSELETQGTIITDRHELTHIAQEIIQKGNLNIPDNQVAQVISASINKLIGWGPLTDILADPTVTEVMVNGLKSVYVERNGFLEELPPCFEDESEILQIVNRIVSQIGRRIDVSSPLVDARLPDGSRVNVIIPPLSLIGPVVTIRRFPEKPYVLGDLLAKNTLNQAMADYLQSCVLDKKNIIVSGGTGGGKTTTLNVLANLIPESERIITIEDAAEIRIQLKHIISLEARQQNLEGQGEIPIRMLLKNALRMRPDRIIVGEIRSGEALDMLQAMNTGHQGSLTTVHANTPLDALLRIETMALMANIDLPLSAIRSQVRQAIHVIVQQDRMPDGSRKLSAIHRVENNNIYSGSSTEIAGYSTVPVFTYDRELGVFLDHR